MEDLARSHGGEIMLLRSAVFHPFPGADYKEMERLAVERAEEYLEKAAADLSAKGLDVSTHVRVGEPAEEILDHAHRFASVVVMTTHGRGGMLRWALGSVADRVVRRSRIPVLIIRPQENCKVLEDKEGG